MERLSNMDPGYFGVPMGFLNHMNFNSPPYGSIISNNKLWSGVLVQSGGIYVSTIYVDNDICSTMGCKLLCIVLDNNLAMRRGDMIRD